MLTTNLNWWGLIGLPPMILLMPRSTALRYLHTNRWVSNTFCGSNLTNGQLSCLAIKSSDCSTESRLTLLLMHWLFRIFCFCESDSKHAVFLGDFSLTFSLLAELDLASLFSKTASSPNDVFSVWLSGQHTPVTWKNLAKVQYINIWFMIITIIKQSRLWLQFNSHIPVFPQLLLWNTYYIDQKPRNP